MARINTPFATANALISSLSESTLFQNLNRIQYNNPSRQERRLYDRLSDVILVFEDIKDLDGPQGPIANWNVARNTGAGQGGLQTPPRTPTNGRTDREFRELEARNRLLTRQLEEHRTELQRRIQQFDSATTNLVRTQQDLDAAKEKIQQQQTELNNVNFNIESLRNRLAEGYKAANQFDLAAQQYDRLKHLKIKEKHRKQRLDDIAGATIAEDGELKYNFKRGKMLLKAGHLDDAEDTVLSVLERRREISGQYEPRTSEDREIQLFYCSILQLQNTPAKLSQARNLYERSDSLAFIETDQSESSRTWALQNAFELVCLRARQGRTDRVLAQLQDIWFYRSKASTTYCQTLEAEALQLVEYLEEHGNSADALSVLEIIGVGNTLSPRLVQHLANQGIQLYERGEGPRALVYLRQVWDHASLPQAQKPKVGWYLAMLLCRTNPPAIREAKTILESLTPSARASDGPTSEQIKTCLAYLHLIRGNLEEATTNARAVFDVHKTQPVLIGMPTHNQANTLLRALCKQASYAKFKDADRVWTKIYEENKSRRTLTSAAKDQIREHAVVGRFFANEWKTWALANKRLWNGKPNPPQSGLIRKQADELATLVN